MSTRTPVRTIETVGALVRTRHGSVARITEVIEWSRLSPEHVTSPGDVVVRVEPVGPSYRPESAWASELTPAQEGDVGAHPAWHIDEYHWHDVRPSWEGGEPCSAHHHQQTWSPRVVAWLDEHRARRVAA